LALLESRRQSLATAESLTGGLIGSRLTGVPGASAVYVGGAITYATRLKESLVGVDEQTLAHCGPVAAATAGEMAAGVALRCDADWGVSATGVAGPKGQDGHPVGQVYVGVAQPATGTVVVEELALSGSREAIRNQAVDAALALLEETLRNADPARPR
jgi:nicotinamide-nucleotide amidase